MAGLLVAILIGIPLGILAGMRPGGVVDRSSVTGTSFGLAIPNFVLGFFLIQVFALTLDWFPAQGYTKFSEDPCLAGVDHPPRLRARRDRGGVGRAPDPRCPDRRAAVELRAHCVRGGHGHAAHGREVRVQERCDPDGHVLGLQLALIGGVVIIEQIFVIPGLGSYMLRALSLPDVPVIQAVTITFVLIYVTLNLLVDISYGYLNPRVRTS